MKRNLLTVIIIAVIACSCHKGLSIAPVASFTVNGDTSSSISIGTYDTYSLNNNSVNGDAFVWDLGNGTTSKEKEIALSYSKPGNYTVTLTAINADGKQASVTRQVKVFERVLKQVVIKQLNWNAHPQPGQPPLTKANVWVEIVQAATGTDYPILSNGVFDAPVVYKSAVLSNIDSIHLPLSIIVPGKTIIDIPTLTLSYGYKGRGYGFNLYAQDATGTYLLSSNFWSGVGWSSGGSVATNTFLLRTGFTGCDFDLICDYEQ